MKERKWIRIGERLAESGWSWEHSVYSDRLGRKRHVAKAWNEGLMHLVVAEGIARAFMELECSVDRA